MKGVLRVGTAAWTIPRDVRAAFDGDGSQLARYARRMNAVEIDSAFHRPHRPSTYARWADEVPSDFRFAVKLPKAITHDARLVDVEALLDRFVDEARSLGDRLGVLLVQLPPSLRFDAPVVDAFLGALRARHAGGIACEPRHATWFEDEADRCLVAHRVTRVAADPAPVPAAAEPGGWTDGFVYFRWHGSPRTYWSAYDTAWLAERARAATAWIDRGRDAWCLFDNTAAGAALPDSLRFGALAARTEAPAPSA